MNLTLETTDQSSYAPVESELISAEEYFELKKSGFNNVKKIRIASPKLGDAGFGGFIVQYEYPVLRSK